MAEQRILWECARQGGEEPVRLVLTGGDASGGLVVMSGRQGDFFVMTPDAEVVAAFVRLDRAEAEEEANLSRRATRLAASR